MVEITQNIKVPISIVINNKSYFSADDLNVFDVAYFIGTHRNVRGIIIKKNIPECNIVYAYIKDNKLIVSREGYVRSKLYLEAEWVFSNIPKMIQLNNKQIIKNENEINIDELYDILPAPEILVLSKHEMFRDSDDNIIEIEVRGEREHNKCFFKAKDIVKGFNIPRLLDTIRNDKLNGYIEDEHYKYFTIKISNKKTICKKEIFLTYEGIIRLLYVSKSKNTKKFISWMTEKLFTIQMGTFEQKQKLTSLLGIHPQIIKDVFDRSSNETPTVYLFNIGPANHHLKTNIYLDDDILCKYGCTKDISRRTSEHERKFKKEYDADISILLYSIIDIEYIHDAETNIKQYFKSNKLSQDDKTELIVINKNNLNQIKQHYKSIQNSYIGRYKEINNKMNNKIIEVKKEMNIKITKLEKENIYLKYQLELKEKDKEFNIELKNKDIELKDNEIKAKDKEYKLTIELMEIKLLLSKYQNIK